VTDLLPLLQEFARDKLAILLQHDANARRVRQYDFNNTYQYVINRDEMHLSWLANAITGLGGSVPESPSSAAPAATGDVDAARIFEDDARAAQAFVDRWRPRVESMRNARQRGMLRVILGEMLEQKRSFEQALAGRTDLLGKRAEQIGPAFGEVLPTRWVE
jgi:hypothetical protein